MGDQKVNIYSLLFFTVIGFQIKAAIGYEPCPATIQSVCDCFLYPFFSVKCTHKNLYEYPDLKTIQVNMNITIAYFL